MSPQPQSDERAAAIDLARKNWESSGLEDHTVDKLGFRVLTRAETQALGFQPCPALYIPYFDLEGNQTAFYRIRYLEPPPGFAGTVAKPVRYLQAAGTLNEVYFPPLLPVPWAEIAKDTNVPIYITEGEKKAAAACQLGLACIGLGGVDSWRATKRGIEILPGLAQVVWKNRQICIIYDSDAHENPNIVRAERQLASELLAREAIPSIASLPKGQGKGLDDFLVHHGEEGPAKLLEILSDAPPFAEGEALWKLNEEIVYVADPGIVIVRVDSRKITPNNFVTHAYANRHYISLEQTKTGAIVAKKKPLARRWVEWEGRAELSRIAYEPGRPQIYDGAWNTWSGWGCEPKKGDVAPWLWLMGFLFKDHVDERRWFEQWLAYPLQNPGTKMYSSAVLWGLEKGTGKTMVAYAMRAIYGKNFIEIKNKDLRGQFNGWAEGKQLIYGDEITGGDIRVDADWLKGLITQTDIRINAKYLPEFVLPDRTNYLFSSNHPDAFFLEDGDRRFFIHEVVGKPAERKFYEVCDQWLKNGGPSALFHYLLNVNLAGFNPREHAPETKAKTEMIFVAKSDVGAWVSDLKHNAVELLSMMGERAARGCDLFTSNQLLYAYDTERKGKVSTNGMARELRRAGYRQVNNGLPVRTRAGVHRLYAIRNEEKWLSSGAIEAAEHFESFFCEGEGKAKYAK